MQHKKITANETTKLETQYHGLESKRISLLDFNTKLMKQMPNPQLKKITMKYLESTTIRNAL